MLINEEWTDILTIVQRYITGEVNFLIAHCYHLHFLIKLNSDKELSIPFYLLKILTKISTRVQSHTEYSHRSICQQGFIKILVLFSLYEIEIPYKYFMHFVGLQEEGKETNEHQEEQEVDRQSEEKRDKGNQ
jgi:hypothetical protein